jgi:formate-dependent nitrite reductase membrane component NrfD
MAISSGRYEQLIRDLRAEVRPQREWIERQGLLLIVGHFLSGVAAGTWLFSLIFGFHRGLAVAYLIAALSGVAHLAFLGRPARFWKMWHARSSWIARGFVGLALFLAGGALYLIPIFFSAAPWQSGSLIAQAGYYLALAGMILLLLYKGFVYSSSKGVPFWTSPILPALYLAYALRGGAAALLVIFSLNGVDLDASALGLLELWIGVSAAVMMLFYLGVMSGSNPIEQYSVRELLRGRAAVSFYVGTLLIGLGVPIGIGLVGLRSPLSLAAVATIGLASVVGDFFVKYSIAKAGIYRSLTAPRA